MSLAGSATGTQAKQLIAGRSLASCPWSSVALEYSRTGVIMAQYEALPDVYEWLIPDAKLTPEGSVMAR